MNPHVEGQFDSDQVRALNRAVETRLQDKADPVDDVQFKSLNDAELFSVDDSVDDINAAFGSYPVRLERGTHELSGPLQMADDMQLVGHGIQTYVKPASDFSGGALIEPPEDKPFNRPHINNLKLDAADVASECLHIKSYKGIYENLWMQQATGDNLLYDQPSGVNGEDNSFISIHSRRAGDYNVRAKAPTGYWGNIQCFAPGADKNMQFKQFGHLLMGCYTYNKGGVEFENARYSQVLGCRFNVDPGYQGIKVFPEKTAESPPEVMRIVNNIIKGAYTDGVQLDGSSFPLEDVVVADNTFLFDGDNDPGGYGAHITPRSNTKCRAYISNNTFVEIGDYGGLDDVKYLPSEGHWNWYNEEAAGTGNTPTASRYPVGTRVHNTDDGTRWDLEPNDTWYEV